MLYMAISFIFLIVDLLWNTADKYKDHNEQYKSTEEGNLLGGVNP